MSTRCGGSVHYNITSEALLLLLLLLLRWLIFGTIRRAAWHNLKQLDSCADLQQEVLLPPHSLRACWHACVCEGWARAHIRQNLMLKSVPYYYYSSA